MKLSRMLESLRSSGVGFEQSHLLGQVPVRTFPEWIFALADSTGAVAGSAAASV